MVFVDANIPTYVHGSDHPLKKPSEEVLTFVANSPAPFFTDAEVLQELLHRYTALRMWPEPGRTSLTAFAVLMEDRIEPLFADDVIRAANLVDAHPRLSARDLVHIAVMERVGATAIITADTTFDGLTGIERLDPLKAHRWLKRFESTSA